MNLGMSSIRPAFLALALLAVPLAGAVSPFTLASVEAASPHDALELDGHVQLFSMIGDAPVLLQGEAGSLFGRAFLRESYSPVNGNPAQCDPERFTTSLVQGSNYICSQITDIAPRTDTPLEGHFVPAVGRSEFAVRAYALDGFQVEAAVQELAMRNVQRAFLSGGETIQGMDEADMDDTPDDPHELPYFATQIAERPLVTAWTATTTPVTLRGDFVLEVFGPSLELDRTYTSGRYPSATLVEPDEHRFIRLYVEDSSLTFIPSAPVELDIASAELDVVSTSVDLRLGGIRSLDDAILVQDDHLPAPYDLTFFPTRGDTMDGALRPADTTAPEAAANLADASSWFWVAAGALTVLALGAVILRRRSAPPLPVIEAAIESGDYRRAVRLSGRALRRDPLQESAQLARAIAWSRMGAHDRIVHHLEPFLRRHDPSDGTLHYVYGLALHDAGELDSAKAAMAEAVRRTPGLLPDVASDLRPTDAEGYS